MEQREQRVPKARLSLKKNIPVSNPAATPNVQEQSPEDFSDFNVEHATECLFDWDGPEDVQPKRRKRRKDKHVEQYRKEGKWQ